MAAARLRAAPLGRSRDPDRASGAATRAGATARRRAGRDRRRERAPVRGATNGRANVAAQPASRRRSRTSPDSPWKRAYIAGVADIDIGGDWYDVIDLDDGRILFVVGDVSGRGLPAATVMAALRYSTRAYAAQGDDPATILTKLGALISIVVDGHFATVLCGVIDVDRHEVVLANAGHPEPLVIDGSDATFVSTAVGVPIGVAHPETVRCRSGLGSARGDTARVHRRSRRAARRASRRRSGAICATRPPSPISPSPVYSTDLAENLPADGPSDDIAILGVKWLK